MYSCWKIGVGEGQGELGKKIFPAGVPARDGKNFSNGDKMSLFAFCKTETKNCRTENKNRFRKAQINLKLFGRKSSVTHHAR